MRRRLRLSCALAVLAGAAPAGLAGATDGATPAGRYGLSAAACRAGAIFATIDADSLTLPGYACKGVRYEPAPKAEDGAIFKAQAQSCIAEGQLQPSAQTFRLARGGDSVQIFWSDGTRSSRLVRCRDGKRR